MSWRLVKTLRASKSACKLSKSNHLNHNYVVAQDTMSLSCIKWLNYPLSVSTQMKSVCITKVQNRYHVEPMSNDFSMCNSDIIDHSLCLQPVEND